jgi:hypothetical protein
MTWLKFAVASLAFSFAISAAAAFEVVDSNNGFAGPAFTEILGGQQGGEGDSSGVNQDDFSDAHIYMRGDHEKEFDGFSYSGFVFDDQVQTPSNLVSIDPDSVETSSGTSKTSIKN